MKVYINESFLDKEKSRFRVDLQLPLRLQKRDILATLGFPQNREVESCPVQDWQAVHGLFAEYLGRSYPFLVIVSEKPMMTLIPPLFIVASEREVIWRNDKGIKKRISLRMALRAISRLKSNTWLEFTPSLWDKGATGGRVIYEGAESQILEIQERTIPARLLEDKSLPVFDGSLCYLEIGRLEHLESSTRLKALGFRSVIPFGVIRSLCKKLQPYFQGFEELTTVSPKPAYEFALLNDGSLVSLDVDWPSQWKENPKKGEEK